MGTMTRHKGMRIGWRGNPGRAAVATVAVGVGRAVGVTVAAGAGVSVGVGVAVTRALGRVVPTRLNLDPGRAAVVVATAAAGVDRVAEVRVAAGAGVSVAVEVVAALVPVREVPIRLGRVQDPLDLAQGRPGRVPVRVVAVRRATPTKMYSVYPEITE